MGKPSKAVLGFMEQYKVDSDEIWEVHGSTWVVKHKALERVAAEVGIIWDKPELKVCDMAQGFAVVLISGRLKDRIEFSFGEASPKNNKNSYPLAMAEKRSKDRVILKLLAAHGSLYSESEADEFEQRQNPHVTRAEDILPATEYDQNGQPIDNIPEPDAEAIVKTRVVDQRPIFAELQNEIHATCSIDELSKWADENRNRLGKLSTEWRKMLRGVYAEHQTAIRQMDAQDNERLAS